METNNQWFSLTDQLNMGARLLELDVHWVKVMLPVKCSLTACILKSLFSSNLMAKPSCVLVSGPSLLVELVHFIQGALRIAHCGGFHSSALDEFINLLNAISKLMGSTKKLWDSETIGCSPSLSSIEAVDQRCAIIVCATLKPMIVNFCLHLMSAFSPRLFKTALEEIYQWQQLDENKNQFVIIYLDTEMDLYYWVRLEDVKSVCASVETFKYTFIQMTPRQG